jgi:hypothetical protein
MQEQMSQNIKKTILRYLKYLSQECARKYVGIDQEKLKVSSRPALLPLQPRLQPAAPFGGTNHSRLGREVGAEGITDP